MRIKRLEAEMKTVVEREPTGAAKYADYRLWIPFNLGPASEVSVSTIPARCESWISAAVQGIFWRAPDAVVTKPMASMLRPIFFPMWGIAP